MAAGREGSGADDSGAASRSLIADLAQRGRQGAQVAQVAQGARSNMFDVH